MSDPLRIALVAEGPTDAVVIEAALRAILGERSFRLQQVFPEHSSAFGSMGTGWVGVYRWCHAAVKRGNGSLSGDQLMFGMGTYDLLLLHLDADVADSSYSDGSLAPLPTDATLPCAKPCPPAQDTSNALRTVLLSWCGEVTAPPRTILCTPSKCMEAWVMASLFPNDRAIAQGIECYANPESRLGQQPAADRIRKTKRDYLNRSALLEQEWPRIATPEGVSQAFRFQSEFLAQCPSPPTPSDISESVP
jgi:hypothetical protein